MGWARWGRRWHCSCLPTIPSIPPPPPPPTHPPPAHPAPCTPTRTPDQLTGLWQAAGRKLVFLANVDPVDAVRALHGLDPETTLAVIVRWGWVGRWCDVERRVYMRECWGAGDEGVGKDVAGSGEPRCPWVDGCAALHGRPVQACAVTQATKRPRAAWLACLPTPVLRFPLPPPPPHARASAARPSPPPRQCSTPARCGPG